MARACAHPHARIAVLRIREEGHEEDLHPLVGHDARQLGELHVVADQHADTRAVRVEGLDHPSAAQAPALHLVGRDVDLLVHVVRAVAAAEEPHVVKPAVGLDVGHAARDDIDIVADGQLDEAVADLLGVLSQSADRLRLAQIVEPGHERRVEILGGRARNRSCNPTRRPRRTRPARTRRRASCRCASATAPVPRARWSSYRRTPAWAAGNRCCPTGGASRSGTTPRRWAGSWA